MGTEHYFRLIGRCLITDGAKYHADEADAYWLLDAAASHLLELGTSDWFALVRLVVTERQAVLLFEDGNGGVRASQQIPFTGMRQLNSNHHQIYLNDISFPTIPLPSTTNLPFIVNPPKMVVISSIQIFSPLWPLPQKLLMFE